ncbi:MAG TPA: FliA/WhiG family RNA polymerase sigma factor [Opitutaceae bacterium]|nr:FliA/WhiG family RNA polymerase sigma factor [Opitutaceae bacterium]
MSPALQAATATLEDSFPAPHPEFEQFVESYIPVVHNVVERFRPKLPSHVDMADLFSVGVTGLIAAVSNYSEDRAKTFGGYAVQRIRGAILDELRRSDTRSRRARLKARMISEATTAIEQRTGCPATDSEVRRELGLSERVFAKWKLVSKQASFVSFDAPHSLDGDGGVSLHESICDESADLASEDIERSERSAMLAERIKDLPEKQRKVIALYYHEGLRFAEIAEAFGVSESRICQIHGQAVKALRAHMTGKSGE